MVPGESRVLRCAAVCSVALSKPCLCNRTLLQVVYREVAAAVECAGIAQPLPGFACTIIRLLLGTCLMLTAKHLDPLPYILQAGAKTCLQCCARPAFNCCMCCCGSCLLQEHAGRHETDAPDTTFDEQWDSLSPEELAMAAELQARR